MSGVHKHSLRMKPKWEINADVVYINVDPAKRTAINCNADPIKEGIYILLYTFNTHSELWIIFYLVKIIHNSESLLHDI